MFQYGLIPSTTRSDSWQWLHIETALCFSRKCTSKWHVAMTFIFSKPCFGTDHPQCMNVDTPIHQFCYCGTYFSYIHYSMNEGGHSVCEIMGSWEACVRSTVTPENDFFPFHSKSLPRARVHSKSNMLHWKAHMNLYQDLSMIWERVAQWMMHVRKYGKYIRLRHHLYHVGYGGVNYAPR